MSHIEEKKKFNPFLIGICGGSASGKSTAASYITQFVGEENCLLFSLDNYFYGPNDEERKHIEDYNFDRPEALDLDLAYKHLLALKEGKTIDMPVYNFHISKRMDYTQKVSPKKIIIFEGIFSLHEKRIRDIMDIKLFFDLDSDIRFFRRILRDISDRSRQIDTVIERYFRFVKPAFDWYILPTKKYADFVIPQDNLSSLPIEIISHNIIINILHSKKEVFEKRKRKESITIIEEDFLNRKYFYNPKIEELSLVTSEDDIKKFNKIIHYIIKRMKTIYYSIYCSTIVNHLLNEHKNKNKDKIRSIFIGIINIDEIKKMKENINKEEKCIIAIFEPNLIQRNNELEICLTNLFNEFKDYNINYELLTVYMTNKTFLEIKNLITNANVKMNYITIYFGDNLFYDEHNIESGGKIVSNLVDSGDIYLTRSNLISKFLFEKNKIQ